MATMVQWNLLGEPDLCEDPAYLKEQVITYIGNKRSLLPLIGQAVETVCRRLDKTKLTSLDLFSGTGIVARFLKRYSSLIYANDLEAYSQITNHCYLTNRSQVDFSHVRQQLVELESQIAQAWSEGFITRLYAPQNDQRIAAEERVFYTRRNAIYLDTARRAIDSVDPDRRHLFLAPLLAKASIHANTSGVFKGFYKNEQGVGQFGGSGKDALTRILGEIRLELPILSRFDCDSLVYRKDANELVHELGEVDLAYLDPPYNQHPYGSNYFMLNLLVDYQPPADISRVSGIPVGWNRSRYNQRNEAAQALFDLIEHCRAKFLLISYNSEGFIPQSMFLDRLGRLGKVQMMQTPYNTFRGSRNLRKRAIHVTEYLYLLEK